jgi:lipopolysaccharide transport system permease protein
MQNNYSDSRSFRTLNVKEIFHYRDLFWVLALRDLKVRYVQTSLGLLWSMARPAATLLVFIFIFQRIANVKTAVPYPLFAIVGLSAWTYFASVITSAGSSIISSQNMIRKIYFPRLVIPLSKALVSLVDFGIALLFVIVLMIYYQIKPSYTILYLPLFLIMNIVTALAFGIWVSALSVRYRDVQQLIPFLIQLGIYLTPVAYPTTLIGGRWLYYLNPMTGIVDGFRWCLIGGAPLGTTVYISFIIVLLIFISGLYYFRHTERVMADIV